MLSLTNDLWRCLSAYLDPPDVAVLSRTCSSLDGVSEDVIWPALLDRDFPETTNISNRKLLSATTARELYRDRWTLVWRNCEPRRAPSPKHTVADEYMIRVAIVGHTGAGKSDLVLALHGQLEFSESRHCLSAAPLVAVDVDDPKYARYSILLFDTIGGDENRLRPLSYHQADCFLVCAPVVGEVSSRDNFWRHGRDKTYGFNIEKRSLTAEQQHQYWKHHAWFAEVAHFEASAAQILVGTKRDLRSSDPQSVAWADRVESAKALGAYGYIEVSAKSGDGLAELKSLIVEAVLFTRENRAGKTCSIW